jgi:flagellar assembly factor FliW
MNVKTRDFGTIQIDDDSVYTFPQGVYGFENVNAFAVFMHEEAGVSFVYLQAVHTPVPCFLVFSPWDMLPAYKPQLLKEDLEFFGVNSEEELIFLTIATVPQDAKQLSINVKSPVVLNPLRMVGRQVILSNDEYSVRYKPFLASGPVAAEASSTARKANAEETPVREED